MEDLDIVDDKGRIIGTAPRDKVHREGLLHREIHVWLYTPKGEIIFQRRAPGKDTFPNMLDASIGGHVDQGEDWMDAALKELEEEAGIKAKPNNLQLIQEYRSFQYDPVTRTKNDSLRRTYALEWTKPLGDLRIEVGKAVGFEAIPIDKLLKNPPADVIPGVVEADCLPIIKKLGV